MRVKRFDGVAIDALAHFLPGEAVPTVALGLETEELVRLTGVRARHVAPADLATSDLVVEAIRRLGGGPPDRLFVATMTPDTPSPATAPLVQHRLGWPALPAMDLAAACAGFVYGLDLAARSVETGDDAVIVAAGECRVRTLVDAPPGVRVLFGDGAVAARVVRAGGRGLRIDAIGLTADGRGHASVQVPAGGSRLPTSAATVAAGQHALRMVDGPHVFFEAIEGFVDLANAFLASVGVPLDAIDLIVPHQPNLRILERVARGLRVELGRFAIEVDAIGNVGGASVGIALDRAWRAGRIGRCSRVLLLAPGAGYTGGVALLEGCDP